MEHLKILFLFSVSNEGFALNLVLCLKPSPCCSGPPGLVLLGTLGCVWWLIWVSQLGRWCNWHVVATGMLLNITRQSPFQDYLVQIFKLRNAAQPSLNCSVAWSWVVFLRKFPWALPCLVSDCPWVCLSAACLSHQSAAGTSHDALWCPLES